MDRKKSKPAPIRRYTVSYRAEDGSKLAEYGLRAEDSFEFEWDRPEAPGVQPALLRLLDARMAPKGYASINDYYREDPDKRNWECSRLVLGPVTNALQAILNAAVEVRVSEAAPMPRFSEGDTVWTDDPLSPTDGVGAFEVLDVLEDFDEDYTDYVLLLAPPGDGDGEKSFCVRDDRAFRTKGEAELYSRRRRRAQAGGKP